MTTIPTNTAAYIPSSKGRLSVRSAPYTSPGADQIVVKNAAVAMNPLDWIKQTQGEFLYGWIKYPFVMGSDVAGEVVEIGRDVTKFRVGDRVVGNALGMKQTRNRSAEGGFQNYTILSTHMASRIPDQLSYEKACVIPLGLSTAACSLFEKHLVGLSHPSVQPTATGKTVIIWGGSTSVGCNATQLAVAAGYEVLTTCSPRNFELVKRLGAKDAFDYNSRTVIPDIIAALKGKTVAGALTVGAGSAEACFDILDKCNGNKKIAMITYPVPQKPPKRFTTLITIYSFVTGMISYWFKSKLRGIRFAFTFGDTLADNEVGPMIYDEFLPAALEQGTFVASPEPQVVGQGLEHVQTALDLLKEGVSAKKLVVTL